MITGETSKTKDPMLLLTKASFYHLYQLMNDAVAADKFRAPDNISTACFGSLKYGAVEQLLKILPFGIVFHQALSEFLFSI
jgi:hypothetical protein